MADGFPFSADASPDDRDLNAAFSEILQDLSVEVARLSQGTASILAAPMLFDPAGNYVKGAYVGPASSRRYGERLGQNIIMLSLNDATGHPLPADELRQRMRHEVMHFLRDEGIVSPENWSALEREAPAWRAAFDTDRLYKSDGLSEEQLNEEAACEAYARWAGGALTRPKPSVERPFRLMSRFYDRVRASVRARAGLQEDARSFFSRLESAAARSTPRHAPVFLSQVALSIEGDARYARVRGDNATMDLFADRPPPPVRQSEPPSGAALPDASELSARRSDLIQAILDESRAYDGERERARVYGRPAPSFPSSHAILRRLNLTTSVEPVVAAALRAAAGASQTVPGAAEQAVAAVIDQFIGTPPALPPTTTEEDRHVDAAQAGPHAADREAGRGAGDGGRSGDGILVAELGPITPDFVGHDTFERDDAAAFTRLLKRTSAECQRFLGLVDVPFHRVSGESLALLAEADRAYLQGRDITAVNGARLYVIDLDRVTPERIEEEVAWLAAPHLPSIFFEEAARSAARQGQVIAQLLSRGSSDQKTLLDAMRDRAGDVKDDLAFPSPDLLVAARAAYPAMSAGMAVLAVHSHLCAKKGRPLDWLAARDALLVERAKSAPSFASAMFAAATESAQDRRLATAVRLQLERLTELRLGSDLPGAEQRALVEQEQALRDLAYDLSAQVSGARRLLPEDLQAAREAAVVATADAAAALDRLRPSPPVSTAVTAPAPEATEPVSAVPSEPDAAAVPTTIAELWHGLRVAFPKAKFSFSRYSVGDSSHLRITQLWLPEDERRHGKGSAILARIMIFADQAGITLVASPGLSHGGAMADQQRFLARHGFLVNRGETAVSQVRGLMYRPAAGTALRSAQGLDGGVEIQASANPPSLEATEAWVQRVLSATEDQQDAIYLAAHMVQSPDGAQFPYALPADGVQGLTDELRAAGISEVSLVAEPEVAVGWAEDALPLETIAKLQLLPATPPSIAAFVRAAYHGQIGSSDEVSAHGYVLGSDRGTEMLRGVAITRSAKHDGTWQLTYFDRRGFSGDTHRPTLEAALELAVREGYRRPDPALLKQAMALPTFAEARRQSETAQASQAADQRETTEPQSPPVDNSPSEAPVVALRIPPVLIELLSSETGHGPASFSPEDGQPLYALVRETLEEWVADEPVTGGYSKTHFRITFADGLTYEGRLDVRAPGAADRDIDLSDHIRLATDYRSRRFRPAHHSDDHWATHLQQEPEDQAEAWRFRLTYALADEEVGREQGEGTLTPTAHAILHAKAVEAPESLTREEAIEVLHHRLHALHANGTRTIVLDDLAGPHRIVSPGRVRLWRAGSLTYDQSSPVDASPEMALPNAVVDRLAARVGLPAPSTLPSEHLEGEPQRDEARAAAVGAVDATEATDIPTSDTADVRGARPRFQEGDRVRSNRDGRHGTVTKVETYTLTMGSFFGGARSTTFHHSYTIRTDGGTMRASSFVGDLELETATPPQVPQDPVVDGTALEPETLRRRIEDRRTDATRATEQAGRRRIPSKAASDRADAERYAAEATRLERCFADWVVANWDAARDLFQFNADHLAVYRYLRSPLRTASEERALEVAQRRAKADASKWGSGYGVGYRVVGNGAQDQINRGFRIVSVDPEGRTALVRQVADTGLTTTGGDQDRMGDAKVPLGDLVRDRQYDAADRQASARTSTVLAEAEDGYALTLHHTTHAKRGHALHVARLDARVEPASFEALLAAAKAAGGYWSNYKGQGAIPGFQFRDKEQAQAFIDRFASEFRKAQTPATEHGAADEQARLEETVATPPTQDAAGRLDGLDPVGSEPDTTALEAPATEPSTREAPLPSADPSALPQPVRESVDAALAHYREASRLLQEGRRTDMQFQANGRYEAEMVAKLPDLQAAARVIATFQLRAPLYGVDPHRMLEALGGLADVSLSAAARAYLGAPARAPLGERPAAPDPLAFMPVHIVRSVTTALRDVASPSSGPEERAKSERLIATFRDRAPRNWTDADEALQAISGTLPSEPTPSPPLPLPALPLPALESATLADPGPVPELARHVAFAGAAYWLGRMIDQGLADQPDAPRHARLILNDATTRFSLIRLLEQEFDLTQNDADLVRARALRLLDEAPLQDGVRPWPFDGAEPTLTGFPSIAAHFRTAFSARQMLLGTGPDGRPQVTVDPMEDGRADALLRRSDPVPPTPPAADAFPAMLGDAVPLPATASADFRIRSQHDLAPVGQIAKVEANLAALALLQRLAAEKRPATGDEQQTLARYSGWGHSPQIFDELKDGRWQELRLRLRDLLTAAEYDAARASTLNAHYTSHEVVQTVWDTVQRLGFTGGRVLEPGCGIGNFVGAAPEGDVQITGVELDPVTGGIARHLYPTADIRVEGFQDTRVPDRHFDLVVGNVPFAKLALHDPLHNRQQHSLHNHFILKSLALAKPGAVIAVLSSRYTLDARNPAARKDMADLADLLGAVRLPETAFRANAGTDAVVDLLILRRRLPSEEPLHTRWIGTDTAAVASIASKPDASPSDRDAAEAAGDPGAEPAGSPASAEATINSYFVEHPEQVLGTIAVGSGMYGADTLTVLPDLTSPLQDQLAQATGRVVDRAFTVGRAWNPIAGDAPIPLTAPPAPPAVKEGAFYIADGVILRRESGYGVAAEVPAKDQEEVRALITLRDLTHEVLESQRDAGSAGDEEPWADAQRRLGRHYDHYVRLYGPVNRFTAVTRSQGEENGEAVVQRRYPKFGGFRRDPDFASVLALEQFDDDSQTATKAAIFNKRVVNLPQVIRGADDAKAALLVVLAQCGRVDLPAIADVAGVSLDRTMAELKGAIYRDPLTGSWETQTTYLSGNVRRKLAEARAAAVDDPAYLDNVVALERVQPRDLMPRDISVRLGAPWIAASDVEAFARQLLDAGDIRVSYVPQLATWSVSTGRATAQSVKAVTEWGTRRRSALLLLEDGLNGREATVWDYTDDSRRKNPEASLAAGEKLEAIQEAFRSWIWQDPKRAERLARVYNDTFNNTVLTSYDGSHLTFPGMSSAIALDAHQKNVAWRIILSGQVLMAHCVGAGKTFASIAAGMEEKRMGLVNKPAYVVPNHMLEQFSREFKQLYPLARLLVADKEEVSPANRKRFVAKCATGDWDAIIITQRGFESIPASKDTMQGFLQETLEEMRALVEAARAEGEDKRTVKQLERALRQQEERIKRLLAADRKDDGIEFELTGIDRLYVDEFDYYKNLYFPTRMQGVGGASSQRAEDMSMKTQFLEARHGPRALVGMTGTPIANKLAEMCVMQTFFDRRGLRARGIASFDAWAANHGQSVTALELAPDGASYRVHTRFAKYRNVPELLVHFRSFADVQTPDMLNLPTPDLAGGKARTVSTPASPALKLYIEEIKERIEAIRAREVSPDVDNMLKVTSDGRKAALDLRLVGLPPDPAGGKVGTVCREILRIHEMTKAWEYPIWRGARMSPNRGALQVVFCDLSTPRDDGGYDVYNDIRQRLTQAGMSQSEIRFVHDAAGDDAKARLFADCRVGRVRVLIGSTEKMGAGTNIQDRLYALHHLDCPWRPRDVEQRRGRQQRQGNLHKELGIPVEELRYGTEGSFDVYMWQTAERKAHFIAQVLKGDLETRDIEEIDGAALSYAEAKAILTGNPLIMERAQIDNDVARLQRAHRAWEAEQSDLRHRVRSNESGIEAAEARSRQARESLERMKPTQGKLFRMTVRGITYDQRKDAGEALIRAIHAEALRLLETQRGHHREDVGALGGFPLAITTGGLLGKKAVSISLRAPFALALTLDLADLKTAPPGGLVQRLEHLMDELPRAVEDAHAFVRRAQDDIASARALIGRPFEKEERLQQMLVRQSEIIAQLSVDVPIEGATPDAEADVEQTAAAVARDERDEFDRVGRRSYQAGVEKASGFWRTHSSWSEPHFEAEAFARELGRAADDGNRPRALGLAYACVERGVEWVLKAAWAMTDTRRRHRGLEASHEFLARAAAQAGYGAAHDPATLADKEAWAAWRDTIDQEDFARRFVASTEPFEDPAHASSLLDPNWAVGVANAIQRLPRDLFADVAAAEMRGRFVALVGEAVDNARSTYRTGLASQYRYHIDTVFSMSAAAQRAVFDGLSAPEQEDYLARFEQVLRTHRHYGYAPTRHPARLAAPGDGLLDLVQAAFAAPEQAAPAPAPAAVETSVPPLFEPSDPFDAAVLATLTADAAIRAAARSSPAESMAITLCQRAVQTATTLLMQGLQDGSNTPAVSDSYNRLVSALADAQSPAVLAFASTLAGSLREPDLRPDAGANPASAFWRSAADHGTRARLLAEVTQDAVERATDLPAEVRSVLAGYIQRTEAAQTLLDSVSAPGADDQALAIFQGAALLLDRAEEAARSSTVRGDPVLHEQTARYAAIARTVQERAAQGVLAHPDLIAAAQRSGDFAEIQRAVQGALGEHEPEMED